MYIKINKTKGITGIPVARVAVAHGRLDSGADQITVFLSAEDSSGIAQVVASLRLSPKEARELAARLSAEAGKAAP